MVQSGDTLVLSLAELLGGKQVDTGVIDRALGSSVLLLILTAG